MQRKNEVMSFNEATLNLSRLLELDTAQLDQVLGGLNQPSNCGTFYGSCSTLKSCTVHLPSPPQT